MKEFVFLALALLNTASQTEAMTGTQTTAFLTSSTLVTASPGYGKLLIANDEEISAPSKYDCNFENGLCTWTQAQDDQFDWTLQTGSTGSANTGPSFDHTMGQNGRGHYIFIEASSPRRMNDTARILSAPVTDTTTKCLHFWYHMYGTHVNTLNVYLKSGSSLGSPVWSHTGTLSNKWYNANINIQGTKQYNMVFEGVRGTSYRGDIGLDDISVTTGSCSVKSNSPTVVQSSVVAAGNQAVVRCTTTGSRPAASITWSYKNTSPSGEQTSTLDSVTNTYTVVSILKLPVTEEDNGLTIQCKVTHTLLVSPAQLTASINLNVQFSVQASSTKITGNRLTIATGKTSLTLNCTTGSSNPASNIKWFNGSSEITNTGPYTTWTGENHGQVRSQLLVFYPTRYMDGDVIRCSVSNILNSQSPVVDTTTLNLQYSPLVAIDGQNQYSWTEGDINKALSCKVRSTPIATITRFHDDWQISKVKPASNQLKII